MKEIEKCELLRNSMYDFKSILVLKSGKYDLLANELGLIYKCSVEIIPYVMTWDGIVTKYHKTYVKRLQIPMNTVETISFNRRRGLESKPNAKESWEPHFVQNKEQPTTNTNEELEKEIEVVEMVERIILEKRKIFNPEFY
ncbi:hypothetical protein CWI38_1041p0030 [Hamiltosporidium tvaerminnensis]|uniref:Uncharacterized protein n=1 Tax=Hamiltosporidium tvaerminnensis TaxID=1176355 RepID=A0A4Q9LVY1_9MICR|nr:hypothetical protein CWI38_1041p0030 [Hamiltosporidium tvaerminnensis]